MKTIATFLRNAREESGITLKELSRHTKIKPEFLDALENAQWERLPELPVLVGFVKSIADVLIINKEQAVALLRRDYPPQKVSINPKPDVKRELRFGQRSLYILLGILGVFVMGGYLLGQYQSFTSPPKITVISPVEGELVTTAKVTVRGTADTTAVVKINGQQALLDANGNFATEIEVVSETKKVTIIARSRTGKETLLSRRIQVSLQKR